MRSRALAAGLLLLLAGPVSAAPPALEVYAKLPTLDALSLAPSGERFAFVAVEGDKRRVFARDVAGPAILTAPVGALKVRSLTWAGDDHLLVNITHTEGYRWKVEEGAVIAVNLKTRAGVQIFKDNPAIWPSVLGHAGSAELNGRWYGFFTGYTTTRAATGVDLYRVDLDDGSTLPASDGGSRAAGWVMDDAGAVIARHWYDSASKSLVVGAGRDGRPPVFQKLAPLADADVHGRGRTPGTVLVSDQTGDADVVIEVDLAHGAATPLFGSARVETLFFNPTTRLLVGAELEGDGAVVLLDSAWQARFESVRKAFPAERVELLSFDAGFRRVLVSTVGSKDAGTYWMVDLNTGKATELDEAYRQVRPDDVGPSRTVRYTASDGLALDGVLTLPPGPEAKRLPLVVLPHGGPIGVYDRPGFDWWAQAFASRGYAVFQPNFRGSGGHGGKLRKAGLGEWGRKMQTDVSEGVAALAAQGVIDPGRVCIVGGSYGGYAALAGVILQKGIYRCAVSYAGVSDLGATLFEAGDSAGPGDPIVRYMRKAVGASWAGDPALTAFSPVYHAAQATAPILLIHGEDDTIVPIRHSEMMEANLRRAGKSVELVRLHGEDHWLSRETTRIEMLRSAVRFVQKHNPAAAPLQSAVTPPAAAAKPHSES